MGQRAAIWIGVIILIAAAGLRVAGIFNEFWIDEIISWDVARSLTSPWQIFSSVHLDNNHHLNTLWMYLLGDRHNWMLYRIPSVISGTISVALMGLLAHKSGKRAAIIAMLLGASSYFLIQYSSEARGYSLAIMFSLAAAVFLDQYLQKPSRSATLGFAACAILAFLSHLSFLYIYLGLVCWSSASLHDRWRDFVKLHGPVLVFILAFFVIDIRLMTVAAGPIYPLRSVIVETTAWTLGLPRTGAWPIVAAILVAGAVVVGLAWLWRRSRGGAIFYAWAIVLGPTMTLLIWPQPYVYPRYFVLCVPFFLVLLARLLSAAPKTMAIAVAVLLSVGNAVNLVQFYRAGRGQYLVALRYMVARDGGGSITIGSKQERRNALMVTFYQRYFPPDVKLTFVYQKDSSEHPPDWFVFDSAKEFLPTAADASDVGAAHYVFDRAYHYGGLSGLNWYLFKRTK